MALKALPHPDNLHLDAASGWLMLGDAESAKAELAKLSPASRARPDVLEFEWDLCARTRSWDQAFVAAERIVQTAPDSSIGWIHRAYAARRMPGGGLPQAWAALRPAADKFPKEYLIPYNLACYAAQLGRPDEAWDWFQRAVAAAADSDKILRMALADADLEPLWPRIAPPKPKTQ